MWKCYWGKLFGPATDSSLGIIPPMLDCTTECCQHPYVIFDAAGLRQGFIEKVYGQDVALKTISQALWRHKRNFGEVGPSKPLVMSLHGAPGTGKSHIANTIIKHLFKKGQRSKFFYTWTGGRDLKMRGEHKRVLVRPLSARIHHFVGIDLRFSFLADRIPHENNECGGQVQKFGVRFRQSGQIQ